MKKVVAITTALILIAALTLFVLGLLAPLVFWSIVGITALLAYKVIPRMN